ncbi:MAG: methyltransferase domain-containing protein [Cyclobacteriaceae bacterium]|nr:methyltransferase domain-containing protein [Cyclobacteriaceae bacterium]
MKSVIAFLIRYVPRKYLQRLSGLGLKVMGIFYRGNNVECPVCNHSYSKFLPYGRINPRPNALCLHCLSLERHRLIWLYLKEKTNFFTAKLDVLHIAPEPCFMRRFEKQHGEKYITADIESPLAKVKMDIHQIPFPENHFDVVLCNHVLEHVADDIKAMSEINRVLKPGGWAIMQVPFFDPVPEVTFEDASITNPRDREKVFGQDDHVRKFGKDYAHRIQRSGLNAEENDFVLLLPDKIAKRYGLQKSEILYLGRKKKPDPK